MRSHSQASHRAPASYPHSLPQACPVKLCLQSASLVTSQPTRSCPPCTRCAPRARGKSSALCSSAFEAIRQLADSRAEEAAALLNGCQQPGACRHTTQLCRWNFDLLPRRRGVRGRAASVARRDAPPGGHAGALPGGRATSSSLYTFDSRLRCVARTSLRCSATPPCALSATWATRLISRPPQKSRGTAPDDTARVHNIRIGADRSQPRSSAPCHCIQWPAEDCGG